MIIGLCFGFLIAGICTCSLFRNVVTYSEVSLIVYSSCGSIDHVLWQFSRGGVGLG